MTDNRTPDRWRLVSFVVLVVTLVGVVSGTAAAEPSTAVPPVHPQQVDVTVSTFGGDLSLGGNVAGNATAVAGRVGAAGRVGGNLTAVLGRQPISAAATVDASVESDLWEVFDTGVVRWAVVAEVRGLNQTASFVRNATIEASEPLAPAALLATGSPGTPERGLASVDTVWPPA